jgi:hypothetical protein
MNRTLFFLSVIIISSHTLVLGNTNSNILYSPSSVQKQTLDDFITLLQRSTGKSWQLENFNGVHSAGIYLKIESLEPFSTSESYRIESNGINQLVITSGSEKGLVFGFYKHLRSLGFRFYLPDEKYTIIPELKHPYLKKMDHYEKPFLQIREFFGTGGFGSNQADSQMQVKKNWELWSRRNGFGSDFQLAGHRGESFMLDNYETLKKNTQWLAKPLTGNKYQDQTIKLNYSNKEALDYYINWTLEPFTKKTHKLLPSSFSEFVSIEPSDGGGYAGVSSISDQVFGAANAAARKLDQLFPNQPNMGVNLYAYSGHAEPPSFALHPRVFVQIIPYQFQNVAFGPSFVKLWAVKAKRFGLYDYLNYPDAQYDLPGGLTLDEAMKRLIHSVKNGSEGTTYESSYSKFSTGIPLYIISRYLADGETNWEDHLAELAKELFDESSKDILQVFNLFYRNQFNKDDLGTVARLLQKADKTKTTELIKQRLDELKLYLTYIDLVYQSRNPENGNAEQRLIPLATYAWKLFPTGIIHSYRIMQLISYSFLNTPTTDKNYKSYQKLHADWFPETDKNRSAWNKIPQGVPASTLNKNFQAIIKDYPIVVTNNSYKPATMSQLFNDAGLKPKRTLIFGGSSLVRGYFGVYAEQASTLLLSYRIEGENPKLVISGVDKNYSRDTAIVLENSSGKINIQIPAGETTIFFNAGYNCTYRVEAKINNGFYFFEGAPRGKMAFYKNFNDPYESYTYLPDVYPSHFYVPEAIHEISYKAQLNQLTITSPARSKVNSMHASTDDGSFEFRKITLIPGESGKIWQAVVGGNFNYNMLNIPDRYFLLEKK